MRGILVLAVLTIKSSYSQNVELAVSDADDVPDTVSGGSVMEVVGDYAHTQSTMTYIPTRLAIRRKLHWSSPKQTIKRILAIPSKRIT